MPFVPRQVPSGDQNRDMFVKIWRRLAEIEKKNPEIVQSLLQKRTHAIAYNSEYFGRLWDIAGYMWICRLVLNNFDYSHLSTAGIRLLKSIASSACSSFFCCRQRV